MVYLPTISYTFAINKQPNVGDVGEYTILRWMDPMGSP